MLPVPFLLGRGVGNKTKRKDIGRTKLCTLQWNPAEGSPQIQYIPAAPGDYDLLDDGTPSADSLLVKAQAFTTEPTVGLVERGQTQVGIIRHNDLHNYRTSYKRNAAVINSPGPFPARASQNVDCATVPLSSVCCCQVSDGVKQIRNVYRAQEIKQKLVCH